LNSKVHPMHHWVEQCRNSLEAGCVEEAEDHFARIMKSMHMDDKFLKGAFDKFDVDKSGNLEVSEFIHFVTYVGFGSEAVEGMLEQSDRDANGVISLDEFRNFVGEMGGTCKLFAQRRNKLKDEPVAVGGHPGRPPLLSVGDRVRSHHQEGANLKKSTTVWDARVLAICSKTDTVRLAFGTGDNAKEEEVPRDWVEEDLDLVEALRAVGIVDDAQHFWTVILPPSEQNVVKELTECQCQAISHTRRLATDTHLQALPDLLRRARGIGISDAEIWSALTWIRDLAPILLMLDLDTLGPLLENDTHYRNQFETKTSNGLLCLETRRQWERTLFGGAYDKARPKERPKYGVFDVMNDHRGVVTARQYGDSYMTLKNVRLRCTFAPEDSGGICASRLAVLDAYAFVLGEYSDNELQEVVRVANAKEDSEDRIGDSEQLDGSNYKEVQIHGDIDLSQHVSRLVVHPRHRVDGLPEERIRGLCAIHGWDFVWMDDERTRRIAEGRTPHCLKTLQMSWENLGNVESNCQATIAASIKKWVGL